MIDHAIAVIETIDEERQTGIVPASSDAGGTRQIGFSVISISLSLVAAFIPLLTLVGSLQAVTRVSSNVLGLSASQSEC